MNDQQKKEISERVYDHLLISVDVFISSSTTESASQLKLSYDEDYSLYKRVFDYAVTHGQNFQELFCTEHYYYKSCFVFDIMRFRDFFSDEERISSLFYVDQQRIISLFKNPENHVAQILISFPDRVNYDNKEDFLKQFKKIVSSHVVTIEEYQWDFFESRALTGATVGSGFNMLTGEIYDPEDDRNLILTLSRQDYATKNITSSFEPEAYVANLLTDAQVIGSIDDNPVLYSKRGYYLYWNKDSEYTIESWLTFPAYPVGW